MAKSFQDLIRRQCLFLACCLPAVCAAPAAGTGAESVQLELTPSAVQLGAEETGQVLLVVRNQGASPIGGVKLHWSGEPTVTVTPLQALPRSLEAHSAVVTPLSVRRAPQGRSTGRLNFWITWTGSAASARGAAVGTLEVQDLSYLGIEKLATIRLEAAIDHLDENQSALLYIIVSNIGPVAITVRGMQAFNPPFISLALPPFGTGVAIEPQESRTFPVRANVSDQAVAGNQRIVIEADLSWAENGNLRSGNLAVAQTLPVTIFGESDLLKLLGVPSFLFLPGFLFLVAFRSLWTHVSPRTKTADSATASETALISVSLSFVSALVYPLKFHRNYLQGYGVRDVMNVWFGSILVAVMAWAAVAGIILLNTLRRRWLERREAERAARENEARIRERTPTKDDSPSEMLRRMQLAGMEAPPEQASVSLGGSRAARSFIVMNPSNEDQRFWIAPPIFLRPAKTLATRLSRADLGARLQEPKIQQSYKDLCQLLYDVQDAGWKVEWGESGAIVGPTPVAANEVTREDRAQGFEFVQLSA